MTYLGEVISLLWMGQVLSLMFLGNYVLGWFSLIILITMGRSVLPRLRFDEMTSLFWVRVLPMGLSLAQLYLVM